MRKIMMMLTLLCSFAVFGVYTVGATVNSGDNIPWTITGPPGHVEVNYSSAIFNEISLGFPVMIFWGEEW
jgi:hypothetical protein